MTPSTDRIFQASDLRRDRAFSDEARRGGARLRDTDGLALLMVPEIEYGELHAEATAPREFVRAAGAVLAINQALDGGRSVAEIVSAGPWPWLDAFELGDLRSFADDVTRALIRGFSLHDPGELRHEIEAWSESARALSDPIRLAALTEPADDSGFVEITPE